MILTKYFNSKYGYDVLKNLRLKVSNPSEFNDPFELLSYIEGEITFGDFKRKLKHPIFGERLFRRHKQRLGIQNKKSFKAYLKSQNTYKVYSNFKQDIIQHLNNTLKELRDRFGLKVLCFSRSDLVKPTEEILMWAHYSEGHHGIRIFFDTNRIKLRSMGPHEVTYQGERIKLDAQKVFWEKEDEFKLLGDAMIMKSSVWKYEHEYRWLINSLDCFPDGKYDFIRINSNAIVRVDVGVNSTKNFQDKLIKLIKSKKYFHIDIRLAELDEKEFKLNYKEMKLS